jgi:four helix bundle protein
MDVAWLGSFDRRSVLGRVKAKPLRGACIGMHAALTRPALAAGAVRPSLRGRRFTEKIMTLRIYPIVLLLVRRLRPYLPALRARSTSLGDQLERALTSIPLNLAEGSYSRGRNRQVRYQSAAASAREALACLETAEALGWVGPLEPDLGALFDQVIGTLVRLIEPRR